MLPENALILAENRYYSMNGYETGLNNNVLVVGSSGCGKTRSVVEPNILQAHGSYIISDPKGVLYSKYAKYLQGMGYEVQVLNFIHPEKSAHYNFFQYIRSERDVIKVAHMLVYGMGMNSDKDPFWDQAAELLLTALIAALKLTFREDEATMQSLLEIAASCLINEEDSAEKTDLDLLFDMVSEHYPDCFACRQYKKIPYCSRKDVKIYFDYFKRTFG